MLTERNRTKGKQLSVALLVIIVVLGLITTNCYIIQYENNYKYKVKTNELKDLQELTKSYEIQYESYINYITVGQYAHTELLMTELRPYQYQYFTTTNTSQLEHMEYEENMLDRVMSILSVIAEFLN